jgi:hypothetical protein
MRFLIRPGRNSVFIRGHEVILGLHSGGTGSRTDGGKMRVGETIAFGRRWGSVSVLSGNRENSHSMRKRPKSMGPGEEKHRCRSQVCLSPPQLGAEEPKLLKILSVQPIPQSPSFRHGLGACRQVETGWLAGIRISRLRHQGCGRRYLSWAPASRFRAFPTSTCTRSHGWWWNRRSAALTPEEAWRGHAVLRSGVA